jgi:hypothetical protein
LFFWTEAQELWKMRNKETHQPENTRIEMENTVRRMYEEQHLTRAIDRHQIFSRDLEDRLRDNDSALQAWIERFEEAFHVSKQAAQEEATANTRRITDYFTITGE